MLEDGLFQLLTSDAGVSALCGTRVYPLILPSAPTLPSLTYQSISSVAQYTMDGPTGLVTARVQTEAWSDSYSTAKALAAAVRTLLDGYSGTLPNGVPVLDIRCDNALDTYEKDARLYRVHTDWLIQYAAQ